MYRNETNFCILILYPAILLNSLISSNKVFVESLGFCMYNIMSSVNDFTFYFPIWIPFSSFSCLIALAGTSRTMLNESGECGHSYLVPELTGKTFSFLPLSMLLAVGLSYIAFIMLKYIPSIPNFLRVFF